MTDLVSIVIPARNEERFIERCLESVSAQTYPNFEILVVDGASTDRTAEVVTAYAAVRDPRVVVLHNPLATTPTQLNVGLSEARGRWMVRIDAHATVRSDYVERAVKHLSTGRWGGVGGLCDARGETTAGQAVAVAMNSSYGIGNSVHHYGTEAVPADHVPFPAYPVALVRELGGWDEALPTNQDFEFDYRLGLAGHELLFDPEMVIDYRCQQSVRGVFRQFRRYGRGKAQVAIRHPRSLRARHLVAPALVLSWLAAPLLARRAPRLAAASFAPYATFVGVASIRTAPKLRDRRARRFLPAVFVAMHSAWGIGFLEKIVPELRCAGTNRRQRS